MTFWEFLINIRAMIKIESDNTVRLCCNKKGCPTITDLGDGSVQITDDNGNKIIVTKDEAKLITDGVKTLEGQQIILG